MGGKLVCGDPGGAFVWPELCPVGTLHQWRRGKALPNIVSKGSEKRRRKPEYGGDKAKTLTATRDGDGDGRRSVWATGESSTQTWVEPTVLEEAGLGGVPS